MRLINGDESRLLDKNALEQYGLNSLVLMENAGIRAADFIKKKFPLNQGEQKVTLVLGKGNNCGDGLVVARHLYNAGYKLRLFSIFPTGEYAPAAQENLKIIEAMGLEVKVLENDRDMLLFKVMLLSSNLIIDGIFGSGFKGSLSGMAGSVVKVINNVNRPILALDIPSGVNSDTGEVQDLAVKAHWTLAFGLPKYGNVLSPGGSYNGELKVIDISFPSALTEPSINDSVLLDEAWALKQMKPRVAHSHKGLFGHVLVLGGSRGMEGSLILAGKGALKTGAGLVTYMMPESLHGAVLANNTEALTYPVEETEKGSFAKNSAEEVLQQTGNKILVMGMGMSRNEEIVEFVKKIVDGYNCPLVMDADALIALSELPARKPSKYPLILTPHPGEMARLLGWNIKDVQTKRIEAVVTAAKKYNAITVLKGNKTLIATPQGKLMVNLTGNPGMATGGMGDVLAGIIGALLGQGIEPGAATALGVYFHGLAGDKGKEDKGEMGLTAEDIVNYLPQVLNKYETALKEKNKNVL
ncbi:MAG: NAD(P)H-hydrate dehydratase [Clostridiales bacterium]